MPVKRETGSSNGRRKLECLVEDDSGGVALFSQFQDSPDQIELAPPYEPVILPCLNQSSTCGLLATKPVKRVHELKVENGHVLCRHPLVEWLDVVHGCRLLRVHFVERGLNYMVIGGQRETGHRRWIVQMVIEHALDDELAVGAQIAVGRGSFHPVEKPNEQCQVLDDARPADARVFEVGAGECRA